MIYIYTLKLYILYNKINFKILASDHDKNFCRFPSQVLFLQ